MKCIYNSPELKSFLIACIAVVCHLSVGPSKFYLSTFSSSSPEPLDHFQPILAQSILERSLSLFKFVQIKGRTLFKGKIIMKKRENTLTKFLMSFFRTNRPISTKLDTKHPRVKIIMKKRKYIDEIFNVFFRTNRPISTKLDTKHPRVKRI